MTTDLASIDNIFDAFEARAAAALIAHDEALCADTAKRAAEYTAEEAAAAAAHRAEEACADKVLARALARSRR
jgi:hypothetical protein